jgi:hypothetical protein
MLTKSYLQYLFFLFLILLFSGCPYTSEIPLNSAEDAVIDDSLIGNWGNPEKEADSTEVLHILPFNAHEYLILFFEEEETSIFRAFSKSIGESDFLTLTEILPETEQKVNYIFARYQIHKDQLQISLVEEKLFDDQRFENSDQLCRFIETHLENDILYDETHSFVRVSYSKLSR